MVRDIKGVIAVVERLVGDGADALHRAGNGVADGVLGKGGGKERLIDPGIGAVFVHADLLGDDSPLFFHALRGKIRRIDEIQEDFQIFLHVLGALHIIGRDVIAGEGVGVSAVAGKVLHGAAGGHVEHLVLQVVRHPLGRNHFYVVFPKSRVHGAVVHGQKSINLGKAGLGHHANQEAAGRAPFIDLLAKARICRLVHPCTPLRK